MFKQLGGQRHLLPSPRLLHACHPSSYLLANPLYRRSQKHGMPWMQWVNVMLVHAAMKS